MDVLILGANGFIGSHLTARILADTDWNVFALDLGSDRLTQWIDSPRVRFLELTLSLLRANLGQLSALFEPRHHFADLVLEVLDLKSIVALADDVESVGLDVNRLEFHGYPFPVF